MHRYLSGWCAHWLQAGRREVSLLPAALPVEPESFIQLILEEGHGRLHYFAVSVVDTTALAAPEVYAGV